ncbi:hypothetical protein KA478_01810, partial [Patescibacteria group bacterium]|nr:hypothetical protein [Patescibacteria group bacterium]
MIDEELHWHNSSKIPYEISKVISFFCIEIEIDVLSLQVHSRSNWHSSRANSWELNLKLFIKLLCLLLISYKL